MARSRPQRPAPSPASATPARCGHGPRESRAGAAPTVRGLGYPDSAARLHPVASVLQFRGQLIQQTLHAVALDLGERDAVDTGCAAIATHLLPRALQNVPAIDLVVERMESSLGGRPWPPGRACVVVLEPYSGWLLDRGHSPIPPYSTHMDKVGALPITGGSVVRPAPAVLLPPPSPFRLAVHFPGLSPVIRRLAPTPSRRVPGRGGLLQFPSLPSKRSTPLTPRGSLRLRFQALHPLVAVAASGRVRSPDGSAPRGPCHYTARAAAHFLRETMGRVRDAGASWLLTVRAEMRLLRPRCRRRLWRARMSASQSPFASSRTYAC